MNYEILIAVLQAELKIARRSAASPAEIARLVRAIAEARRRLSSLRQPTLF